MMMHPATNLATIRRRDHGQSAARFIGFICLAAALLAPGLGLGATGLILDNGTRFRLDPKVAEFLAEHDIETVIKPFTKPLSAAMLEQFEFVILANFAGLQAPWFALPDKVAAYTVMERNVEVLRGYVEAGGGLFFAPDLGEAGGGAATEAFAPLLEPWGVSFTATNARDDAHAWETYSWTTNIAASPVTKGVTRLYYPTQMGRWDDLYPTPPITLHNERWEPLVRGMAGSVTARCLRYADWFPVPDAQNPSILAATAAIGKGRVALFTISPIYTLTSPYQDPKKTAVGEFTTGIINGTVLEKADAARAAGYAILVMTETFEAFDGSRWAAFLQACEAATTDDLIVIAGLDLADAYGARYLLFGQSAYPASFMLAPGGKALKETPYMMLGLTPSTAVLARPGSSPLPHEIYKFFSAMAVYTYRDGKLVDNGMPAYEWHVHNRSDPIPLAVHEVYSPAGIAVAAKAGHQLFVPADTALNASWYLRHGHQHYWEVPSRFLVTSGPVIRSLTSTTFTVQNNVPNLVDPVFSVGSDSPITDIRYYADHNLLRRWTPNATEFRGEIALTHAQRTWGFLVVTDAKDGTAISPPLRGGDDASDGLAGRCPICAEA